MELWSAKRMARELMIQHGVGHWKLGWMDERHTAGTCRTLRWHTDPRRSYGEIKLSRVFFEYFDVLEARDVILHEIAHALTDPREPGHGRIWRAKARAIGGKGAQYVDPREHVKPQYDWLGVCPQGHKIKVRTPAKISCRKCSKIPSEDHLFVWQEAKPANPLVTALQDLFLGV